MIQGYLDVWKLELSYSISKTWNNRLPSTYEDVERVRICFYFLAFIINQM